jgi:transposase-like protein
MDITSFVGKLLEQDDVDALREGVRVLAQAVMETEVSGQIGAAPYERSTERTAYRNGYRTRRWDTRVGTIELKIPKLTAGAYFPSLLEPRRRAEKALHAVVVEAYVKGVSTRKVDDLVKALGIDGISRSEVSRICKVLDDEVRTFLARPIEIPCPYVWLDATFHKVREAGRVISVATVVAIGVTATGERTVLGAATGPSEDHQFWTSFLRSLVKRGLKGVRLVISDAHEGLRQAIEKILHEATWQRSSVNMGDGGAVPLVISAAGMRTLAA